MTIEYKGILGKLRKLFSSSLEEDSRESSPSRTEQAYSVPVSAVTAVKAVVPKPVVPFIDEKLVYAINSKRKEENSRRISSDLASRLYDTTSRKILVVEDNPNYLEQLRDVFSKRDSTKLGLDVTYAPTLDIALQEVESGKYDGVMCDLFFPKSDGLKEELNGLEVGKTAFNKGLPLVFVTSTYHHDNATEPAHKWAMKHGFKLIDTRSSKKNFRGALLGLGYAIEGNGELHQISSDGYRAQDNLTLGVRLGCLLDSPINNMDYLSSQGELGKELRGDFERSPLLGAVAERYCGGLFPELESE